MSKIVSWVLGVVTVALVLTLVAPGAPGSAEAATQYESGFGTTGTAPGEFGRAAGIAMAANGDLWVVDTELDRVEEFSQSGEYLTQFGSRGSKQGQLQNPTGIDIDSQGNIWIADTNNIKIKEFNENGEYIRSFGAYGQGNNQLAAPRDVAVDAEGDVWVTDSDNNRIQKYNETGKFLETVKPAGLGSIKPANIAIGPEGVVWVSDLTNNRIVAFSEAGALLREVGSKGSGPGQFKNPYALDVDAEGNVWVEDQQNERVEEFSAEGEYIATFGSGGTGTGQFSFTGSAGIVTGPEGRFWITNGNAPVIQRWGPESLPTCSPAAGVTQRDNFTWEIGALHCTASGSFSYELVSGPEHGDVSEFNSETGDFRYEPEPGYVGDDPFTFTATNKAGSATPATFDMSVGLAPECHSYFIVIPAGQPHTFGPEPFSNCEGEGVFEYAVHVGSNPYELQHGKISEFDPKTGALVYTPEPGFAGEEFFSFVAINRFGESNLSYVWITVKNLPVCQDGFASAYRGEGIFLKLECEGEGPVEWQLVSGPEHGVVNPYAIEEGRVIYSPEPEFEGTDSFTFKMVGEAGDSVVKTFEIAVGGSPPEEEVPPPGEEEENPPPGEEGP